MQQNDHSNRYVAFSAGKKCEMSFCRWKMVDIISKIVQKKQDSCSYESRFVAVNHGYFPILPGVAFTFRFNHSLYGVKFKSKCNFSGLNATLFEAVAFKLE